MRLNILRFAFHVFLFFIYFSVYSQENSYSEEIPPTEDLSSFVYVINSFDFNIEGITRRFALINKADLIIGEEITGLSNLERYIQNKQQLLYNERVLDSVSITYRIGPEREGGKYPVDVIINTKDTWNIVAIPRPQFDSNTGFDLTVKARDYNFLGTMNPLRFDIGYSRNQDKQNFINLMLDSDIPIRLFDLDWNFNFDHDFSYRPDMSLDIYYRNVTGLSVDIPFGFTTSRLGFDVQFIYNEENADADKDKYGDFQEGLYISTRPYISWRIPITEVGNYGELIYTPRVSAVFNSEIASWTLSDNRKGPFLGFSHSLGFGRVNWIDNFQQGFSSSINNSFNFDFYELRNDNNPLSSNIRVTGAAHFLFFDIVGLSTRLMYRQWFNSDYDKAGDVMRGILDKEIKTDFMISLNIDIPVRVLRIRPSQWFNWNLRLIDFDLHLGPVLDIAVANTIVNGKSDYNFYISGGFETVIFPDFFRSLYLRISTAWDFTNISRRTPMELFIGTDFHF